MNDLIHRYLDGELSEEEARELRRAIAQDPEVEAELRAWERMLGAAAVAESGAPSAAFNERVMESVSGRRRRFALRAPRLFDLSWGARLAWAATAVATFALGLLVAGIGQRGSPPSPALTAGGAESSVQNAAALGLPDPDEMRVVRLVYRPRDPGIQKVHVAGTFNGWDPDGIAMERKGELWTAILILPRGTYEYMFVEDDARWVTDPLALQTRDDGFGRKNAVLDLAL